MKKRHLFWLLPIFPIILIFLLNIYVKVFNPSDFGWTAMALFMIFYYSPIPLVIIVGLGQYLYARHEKKSSHIGLSNNVASKK